MSLYVDDSGARHPDCDPKPASSPDWFALGGVLVRDAEKQIVKEAHDAFCGEWGITYPLHSADIRKRKKPFDWVGRLSAPDSDRFHVGLTSLVTTSGLTALACVVDRPGYNARYRERYGRARWSLCKTAFNVIVERAAKFARSNGCRLRVLVERSGRDADRKLGRYYKDLLTDGLPFDANTSSKYKPLGKADFQSLLIEFGQRDKRSRMMQLADLALWPVCIGGYNPQQRNYLEMREAGMLIDSKVPAEEIATCGIKYSCWELRAQKTPEPGLLDRAPGSAAYDDPGALPCNYSDQFCAGVQATAERKA